MRMKLSNSQKLATLPFPSLETFRGKEFQHQTLATNYVFHDLVFQDMNTSEHDCQDLAATGLILTFLFQDLVSQVLKWYSFFAIPCPQVLTMIALFKTWLSNS